MAVKNVGHVDLPEHRGTGGFDHADVHSSSDRLYVAHTRNDAIDVIDCTRHRYIDVVDIGAMRRVEVVPTEAGAHTLALDRKRNRSMRSCRSRIVRRYWSI